MPMYSLYIEFARYDPTSHDLERVSRFSSLSAGQLLSSYSTVLSVSSVYPLPIFKGVSFLKI
jgi:hypothetical protein